MDTQRGKATCPGSHSKQMVMKAGLVDAWMHRWMNGVADKYKGVGWVNESM